MNTIAEQAVDSALDCDERSSELEIAGESHRATRERFDSPTVAARYPSSHSHSRRDRREWGCIARLLSGVPAGARVLDLPCGTGRMTGRLLNSGYGVTAADSSPHMLQQAQTLLAHHSREEQACLQFSCCDVLQTPFADGAFDAVLCNRLFHHFVEPETRRAALCELARICRGPIIVSFFRNFGIDAFRFHLKHALRGTVPCDRIPISLHTLRQEIGQAGLDIVSAMPTRWGISPQWYVQLAHRK